MHEVMQAVPGAIPECAHLHCNGTSVPELLSKLEWWKNGSHPHATLAKISLCVHELSVTELCCAHEQEVRGELKTLMLTVKFESRILNNNIFISISNCF